MARPRGSGGGGTSLPHAPERRGGHHGAVSDVSDPADLLTAGATVVLIGDSITDAGRTVWGRPAQDDDLGAGYVRIVASLHGARFPERAVRFVNRGVAGDRTRELEARWSEDCLALAPDVVSVLIGVNDTWRAFDAADPTSVEEFEQRYRRLLTTTVDATGAALVLGEPFVVPVSDEVARWRSDLDPKIEVVRALATELGARLVPYDQIFAEACEIAPPTHWAPDGVHPSPAGHGLMALAWLEAVGAV
jgi:acyl-CoA thioesterase I